MDGGGGGDEVAGRGKVWDDVRGVRGALLPRQGAPVAAVKQVGGGPEVVPSALQVPVGQTRADRPV